MAQRLGRALLVISMIGYFVFSNWFAYGSKVTFGPDEEVYYKNGATEEEARKVGKVFQDVGIFNGSNHASLQLQKDKSGAYLLRMVTKDGIWNDPETCEGLANIGYMVSQDGLSGAPVKVDLCNDEFESQKILAMKAPEVAATPAPTP